MTKQEINNVVKSLKQGDRVFMTQLHSPYKSEFIFEYLSVNLLSLYCTVAHAPYKIEIDDIAHIELLNKQEKPMKTKKAYIILDENVEKLQDFLIKNRDHTIDGWGLDILLKNIFRNIRDLPQIDVEVHETYTIKAQDIEIEG